MLMFTLFFILKTFSSYLDDGFYDVKYKKLFHVITFITAHILSTLHCNFLFPLSFSFIRVRSSVSKIDLKLKDELDISTKIFMPLLRSFSVDVCKLKMMSIVKINNREKKMDENIKYIEESILPHMHVYINMSSNFQNKHQILI